MGAAPSAAALAWYLALRGGLRLRARRQRRQAAAEAAEYAAWRRYREAMLADLGEVISVAEAARRTGRSTATVRRWIKRGAVRTGALGRGAGVRATDVMAAQHHRLHPKV